VPVTDRSAFLSLALGDGSQVVMPSNSAVPVLTIDGRSSRFELLQGEIESHVEKQNGRRFEVRTRSASLGVRGTHFRVRDEAVWRFTPTRSTRCVMERRSPPAAITSLPPGSLSRFGSHCFSASRNRGFRRAMNGA
jgi:ferric-dicitrate binding protein FerR (iron transport regulator)